MEYKNALAEVLRNYQTNRLNYLPDSLRSSYQDGILSLLNPEANDNRVQQYLEQNPVMIGDRPMTYDEYRKTMKFVLPVK